jgi:D-alanyl-D-alanine carboxypeptidase (penicillin-binding protein 5/6)
VPSVAAATWVLADASTRRVLAARGAHTRRAPASTLKTLTALTLIPQLDPDERYRVTEADVRVEGSKVGLLVGQTYTHRELFTALFLPSGNDAAAALASANGGKRATLAQMNERARELGALDTIARDPSGLDANGQRSSAYDLALIARAGLADPEFARYAALRDARFPGAASRSGERQTYQIQNQNPLLREGYDGTVGVKTGFTTQAGRTFVGAATREGRTLIVALMGITEPTGDAAARLLDWGFANASRITEPAGVMVDGVSTASDEGADDASTDAAASADDGPGLVARGLTGPAVVLGLGMLTVAIRSSDPMVRRRIRRRYR